MKNRYSALSFTAIITTVAILFSACRKINEATEVGGGLIPPVDNITTFDTTLSVQAFNDTFGLANDSQYLSRAEEHFLGIINNDPFFGKTDARMFFELKPAIYGAYPFARKDSVKIDSIVLVMSYLETYGATNTAQQIKVYELDQSNNFKSDSAYLIRKENLTYNTSSPLSLPGQIFFPRNLNDTVKAFRDTTTNQLRIKLDTNFARRLFNYATSNAYKTDSIFRANFKGFAVRAEGGGNAVMGFAPSDFNTKLAIYYNHPKVGSLGPLSDPVAVNMRNPHAVFFVSDATAIDLARLGPQLEHHPIFPERANIGIAQILAPDRLRLRVWERGAGITLACGSGACAALVAAARRGLTGRRAFVVVDGGELEIEWLPDGHVAMTGPVATSFSVDVAL